MASSPWVTMVGPAMVEAEEVAGAGRRRAGVAEAAVDVASAAPGGTPRPP